MTTLLLSTIVFATIMLFVAIVSWLKCRRKNTEIFRLKGRLEQAEKDKKTAVIAEYASKNSIVHQLIDLALLQNGMLKGEALDKFLKRSVDLIK